MLYLDDEIVRVKERHSKIPPQLPCHGSYSADPLRVLCSASALSVEGEEESARWMQQGGREQADFFKRTCRRNQSTEKSAPHIPKHLMCKTSLFYSYDRVDIRNWDPVIRRKGET